MLQLVGLSTTLDCLLQYVLQWLNPHNWYLMMFSPATIHVLPFDPQHGSDNARVYAGKYASKPEKVRLCLLHRDSFNSCVMCILDRCF